MKFFKYYIIIFLSELIFFYGFLMLYIAENIDFDKDLFQYTAISAVGVYFTVKYNLLLRQKGMVKSIYFSIIVLCCVLLIYWYFLEKYSVTLDFLDWSMLYLIMPFPGHVYGEYVFRVYDLNHLEKKYK